MQTNILVFSLFSYFQFQGPFVPKAKGTSFVTARTQAFLSLSLKDPNNLVALLHLFPRKVIDWLFVIFFNSLNNPVLFKLYD